MKLLKECEIVADRNVYEDFNQAVGEIFVFLVQKGFKKINKPFKEVDTYTQIVFIGKNVALSFSYDFTENVCDCDVAKVENGTIVKLDKSMNLWFRPLFSFLVDRYKYRGGVKVNCPIIFKQFHELYKFNELLNTVGKNLIDDNIEVFK